MPKFKFESDFSTWLYRIVINESITISKKNKQNVIFIDTNSDNNDNDKKNDLINLLKSKDNTEKQLMQQETQQTVQTAIILYLLVQ